MPDHGRLGVERGARKRRPATRCGGSRRRRLAFESLETRHLLAGDLTELARLLPAADAADTQHGGDGFGLAVAIDGDTAVVGAYSDGGERPVAGAAYVYTRTAGTWNLQQKLTASDAQFADQFGRAVAISGETILVGAVLHDSSGLSDSGAVYAFTRSGTVWSEQQKLAAGDAAAGDWFGSSLAIVGEVAIVGAPGDDTAAGADAGSVYVFAHSGTVWTEQQKLTAPDAAPGDAFGTGLDLDGSTAIVGAYRKDIGANAEAGAAYVFTHGGTTWSLQQTLTSAAADAGDWFGGAVAVGGDVAVIGAPGDDTAAGAGAGSAEVWTRSGSVWTRQQQLLAAGGAAGDALGISVGLEAGTIVVGAYQADTAGGVNSGAVYMFADGGGTWSQEQQLTAADAAGGDALGFATALSGGTLLAGAFQDDTAAGADAGSACFFSFDGAAWSQTQRVDQIDQDARGDTFGTAVSLDGDTLVIGAPRDDVAGIDAGAVYVFTRSGTSWSLQQKLAPAGLGADDRFGLAVGLRGDTLVVGAPQHNAGAVADAGAVYVFTRSGGSWTLQQMLAAADAAANDYFGAAVSLGTGTLVVGAEGDDTAAGADTGSAYVFAYDGNTWNEQQKLTAADGAAGDRFGQAVALDGETALIGASHDDLYAVSDAGSAYVFARSGAVWSEQQKLTPAVPYSGERFGSAVAIRGGVALLGAEGGDAGFVPAAGAAYVFTSSGGTWSQQQRLTAADPAMQDRFGHTVAIGQGFLAVGADLRDALTGTNAGAVYVFGESGGSWSQQQALTGRDEYASDTFGTALAISGSTLVAGAPLADLAGGNSGGVYVFGIVDTQPPTIAGTAPPLAAGSLTAGTTLLEIEFSEAVVGGSLAANYQLQSLGPDGLLGTADDVNIPLAVTYGAVTATLTFSALPESVYRLRVGDAITDVAGNVFDGDVDGTAGGDWVVDVGVVPPDAGVFASQPTYLGGEAVTPQAVAHADFDGDGHLDLVTANRDSHNVTLSLGDGAGAFVTAGTFSIGGFAPQAVTVGDLNADGNADLAVAHSGGVGVLLGTGTGGFSVAMTYASGGAAPKGIAVGDFNGDGRADLALANGSSHNVGVLLGDGTGGFAAAMLFAAGGSYPHPYGVAVGDFNADGKADLVLANSGYSNSRVAVLLGTGTGAFADPVLYPSGGTSPYAITVADFNADGKPDVATANNNSNNVSVLLGNGTGGLGTAKTIGSGGTYPYSIMSGDFSGDGIADLVVANHGTDNVAVLRSYGTGSFAAAVAYASGGDAPTSVTVGDFNGDNKPDVAVTNSASSNVGVLRGTGSSFAPLAAVVTYASGAALPRAVATGDFNGDGHADLAIANEASNNVAIRLGTGSGEFGPAATFASGGTSPYAVAAGDFNADGKADLVVVNHWSRNVGVLLGNGKGEFSSAVIHDSGGNNPWSVVVADVNADGALDLAVANSGAGTVGVLLGTGTGSFAPVVTYSSGGSSPRSVAVGDFNRDGKPDLAVSNNASQNVGLLLGTGSGSFGPVVTYPTGGSWAHAVTVADFNRDGRDDLAVADYPKNQIDVLLGDGTGGFGTAVPYPSGGEGPGTLTAGDFNADGQTDLAVANQSGYNTGSLTLLWGNGTGGFASPVSYYSGGAAPKGLTAGDFNGDGQADLALANPSSQTVGLLFGAGAAGFTTSPTFSVGPTYARSVAVADFNGDGNADVAAANVATDTNLSVLLGNGVGGLAAAVTYSSGANYAVGVTVADFNGDGNADLAVANDLNTPVDNLGILLGDGSGAFAPVARYSSGGNNPHFLTTGDFNGDGIADLVVSNRTSHTISVLLSTGAGGFDTAVTYSSGGMYPRRLAVGDFNADDKLDIAVANSDTHDVGVLLGDGLGGFAAAVTYASGGASPQFVTVGDFNADGHPDLAVTNTDSHDVGVLLGLGRGGFAPAAVHGAGGQGPQAAAVGDFDGDGRVDLAVANYATSTIGILWGTGRGDFAAGVGIAAGPGPSSLAVSDLNGDGRNDLVTGVTIGVGVLLDAAEYRPGVHALLSPQGLGFAVQTRGFGAGQLVEAGEDAADGLGRLEVAGQTLDAALRADFLQDNGQTVVTGVSGISGLHVQREITVPATGSEGFSRTVDVFTNPTDQPITTTVRIVGNLGSDAATTVWQTSDGDAIVEPTDQWIGTDDADGTGSPAIVHFVHGPRGLVPTDVGLGGDRGDNIYWTYELTVPAGETVRLAHFTILANTRSAAEASAAALVTATGFGGQAEVFLREEELLSLANFQFDTPPAGLSASLDGAGNLTIADSEMVAQDNQLTIRRVNGGGNLEITDANVPFLAAPSGGTLSNGDKTLTVPLVLLTAQIIVHARGGTDTLTIDFSDGNPIPAAGLEFHGGDPTSGTPGDTLVLDKGTAGGLFATITHTLLSASDGSVRLDPDGPGGAAASVIQYTGLEPISDNLDAVDRVFSFAGAAETITLTDVGGADGNSRIASTLGESVTFANPAASLTVTTTAGTGADAIHVEGLDVAFDAGLIVAADADDTLRFQTNPTGIGTGDLDLTAGNIRFTKTLSTAGAARLEALGGAILDDLATSAVELVAAEAILVARTGIALDTALGAVEADAGGGMLSLSNAGPLTVGGVTDSVDGVLAGDDISIQAEGDLTLSEPVTDTVGAGYVELSGYTVLVNAAIRTNGSTLDLWSFDDGVAPDDGDLILNAALDTEGGDVYLYCENDLTINSSVLTQGGPADIRAYGNLAFSAAGRIDVGLSPVPTWLLFDVTVGGNIVMADGSAINAGDGQIQIAADGNITLGSLVGMWYVSVFSRDGSILDGGDADPDIVSETADLIASRAGAVGTEADPLDTQLDELSGASVGGFFVENARPLDVTYSGIDAGGDVQLTAGGEVTIASAILSGGTLTVIAADRGGANVDNITVAANVMVTAAGDVQFRAGDRIVVNNTASVQATGSGGTVVLDAGAADADGDGALTLDGTIQAAGNVVLNLNAASGAASQAGTGMILASGLQLLSVGGGGSFDLAASTTNHVAILAAATSGEIAYRDAGDVTVGQVASVAGTTAGSATAGSAVTILALDGTITVDAPVTTTPGTGGEVVLIGRVVVHEALTPGAGMIRLEAKNLTVSSVTPTSSGFAVQFNRPLALPPLNLYDQGGIFGAADVLLTGPGSGVVRGSLVVSPDARNVTLIKTVGLLEPGAYTIALRSGPTAFQDASGTALDGDGDGVPGGDYVYSFVVGMPETEAVIVRLPNVTRGYGQSVNIPADDLTAGLPLTLSDGVGLSGLNFNLHYDTALLEITGFVLDSGVVDRGGIAQLTFPSAGVARLTVDTTGSLGAAAGPLILGAFTARVPDDAPYGAKHVLDISSLRVYDNGPLLQQVPSIDDDAIHVAAFLGDTSGDGWYNSPDATLTRRIIGQINTGFGAYPLADPVLIADITGNGLIQSNDTTAIRRAIGQIAVPDIPPLPQGLTMPAAASGSESAGVDRQCFVPFEPAIVANQIVKLDELPLKPSPTVTARLLTDNEFSWLAADSTAAINRLKAAAIAGAERANTALRDRFFDNLETQLLPLESLRSDLADAIALAGVRRRLGV